MRREKTLRLGQAFETRLSLALVATVLAAPAVAGSYTFSDVFRDEIGPDQPFRGAGDAEAVISDDRTVLFYRVTDFVNGVPQRQLFLDRDGQTSLLAGEDETGDLVLGPPRPGATVSDNGDFILLPLGSPGSRLVRVDRNGLQVDITPPGGDVGIVSNVNRDALGFEPTTLYDTSGGDCQGAGFSILQAGDEPTCSIRNDGTASFRTQVFGVDVGTGASTQFDALAYGSGGPITLWDVTEFDFTGNGGFFRAFDDDGLKRAAIERDNASPADDRGLNVLLGSDIALLAQTTRGPEGGFAAFDEIEVARDQPGDVFLIGSRGGVRGVFSSLVESAPAIADNTGPFADFSGLSVNDDGDLAFLAEFDGGGSGIYTGGDPIADKVLQVGDVIDGRTVVDLGLRSGDAVNNDGDIVFDALLSGSPDPYRVMIAAPRDQLFLRKDLFAQLSTASDFTAAFSSTSSLVAPDAAFDFAFTLDWLSGDGELEVLFGDHRLGLFGPDAAGRVVLEMLGLSERRPAPLRFLLTGDAGTTVSIDDVVFPGLRNGDFESGYLEGWRREGDEGVLLANARLEPVPLPAGGWLLLAGLGGLAALRRARGRAGGRRAA